MSQEILDIEKVDLLNRAADMKNTGHRLAQICAVKSEGGLILLYSFVKDGRLLSLRFPVRGSEQVESVGWLYPYAFLYENEMKELFGLSVSNMNLDFGGHLYEMTVKTPFVK